MRRRPDRPQVKILRFAVTDGADENIAIKMAGGQNVLSTSDLSSLTTLLPGNTPENENSDMGHTISAETQNMHFEFDEQTLRSLQQFMESQGLHPQVPPV